MKLLKKFLVVSCSILLICSLVSCKSSSKNSTVYGRVTSINDNVITLSLGEMDTSSKSEGENASKMENRESGTAPTKGEKQDGNSQKMPEGETDTVEKGASLEGKRATGMGGFTENGETLEITIDDESIIKVGLGDEVSEGSLGDIQENSILYVEYNDNNSIKSITVQSFGRDRNNSNKMSKPESNNE